jgi:short-subunit dehydrogenase
LCPGFTWSEFHDVTGTREKMNKLPGYMWLNADEVVRQGIAAVERGDAVYIPGRVNRFIKTVLQWMPDRLAQRLSARQGTRYRDSEAH